MSSRNLARRACAAGLAAALCALPLAACSRAAAVSGAEASGASVSSSELPSSSGDMAHLLTATDYVSDRDLDPSYEADEATTIVLADDGCAVAGGGASAEGSTVTITEAGTYVISGSLSDGQLVVDADGEKVQLVLDGASVTSADSAALLVRAAKKVWVTLADGTQSALATAGEYAADGELNVDGAVFCKADLTVNGGGSLTVSSSTGHGIVCKDELVLVSGEVTVDAARHAIQAKDALCAVGGAWSLAAGTDGIHCGSDDDADSGVVLIAGGSFSITAASDGVDAAGTLEVDGGELSVAAGDDGVHSERALQVDGGVVTVSESYEGLEGATVTVNGGAVDVTSSDDGINAAGDPVDGESATGSDTALDPGDGESAAGPDAAGPAAEGAAPDGAASPGLADGAPGAGAEPPSGDDGQGRQAGGRDDYDETARVSINGGSIVVCAGGDGIDSNGDLYVTGGETYVFGPTSDGDGSLDFPGTGTISGGVVVCAGSAGMAQNFSDSSAQGSLLLSASGEEGDEISLTDADGAELAACTARRSYSCVLVSAPGIAAGSEYTLRYGDGSAQVVPETLVYTGVVGAQAPTGAPGGPGEDPGRPGDGGSGSA